MEIKQYQIILVGSELTMKEVTPEKTRQCVVISPDEMNTYLKTIIIAPFAENTTGYPTRPKVRQNNKTSRIALDQITTIEKKQAVKILGDLQGPEIKKIKAVLREILID